MESNFLNVVAESRPAPSLINPLAEHADQKKIRAPLFHFRDAFFTLVIGSDQIR